MRPKINEIGGYRLIREIGRGGFGSVHLGEDESGQRAAVKLLHVTPSTDPHFFTLFAREVEAARRVNPFCIAQVLDADPHAEQPWIAVEYIDGPSLSEQVRERGPRTGADLQRLAVATATALSAIHAAGIVHRDFKPSNIMIAPDGPRVIDFGIARAFEESTAFTASAMIGSPHYMAPEQLESDSKLTPALDVYSWGAVVVFAATGRPVFEATRQSALIKQILCDTPDCENLPEPLRTVVARCLRKEPEQRPTARALIDLLTVNPPTPEVGPAAWTSTVVSPAPLPRRNDAPSDSRPRPGRPTGAFLFAGRYHGSPGDLAETMQRRWIDARQMFSDHGERRALATWVFEEHHGSDVDPELLRRPPADPDVAVARFVSQVRPDLPPVFAGQEMTLAAMGARARSASGPVAARADVESLRVLADHHCADAEHTCSGGSCAGYRHLLNALEEALSSAERAAANHNLWLSALGDLLPDPPRVDLTGASAVQWVLTALLTPELWQRALSRALGEVPVPWRHLVPRGHPDAPRTTAAGIGFVTVSMCDALVRIAAVEEDLRAKLREWEAHQRTFGPRLLAIALTLTGGVGLSATLALPMGGAVSPVVHMLCFLPLSLVLGHWLIKRKEIGHRSPPWMEITHFRAGFGRRFRIRGEEMRRALDELRGARGRAETHPFVSHA